MLLTLNLQLNDLYKEQASDLIDELTQKTDNAFRHYLGNMDRMAIQLMTNPDVKTILKSDYNEMTEQEKLSCRQQAESILMNVISPIFEMRRVTMFSDSVFFTIGVSETRKDIDKYKKQQLDFLKKYFEDDSAEFYISPIQTDLWSDNQTELVTFTRCVRLGGGKLGFIEIQQDYDNLWEELKGEEEEAPVIQVNNSENKMIFLNQDANRKMDADIYNNFRLYLGKGVVDGSDYYYQISAQEDYNLIIFVAHSKHFLFQYYYDQRNVMVVISISVLLILFVASWYLSKRLTKPLKLIKKQMDKLTINNLNHYLKKDSHEFDEMNQIYDAFNNMNLKLQESIESLIESKKMEYKAQRASLQSQISPHFIGNTLTVIGAKGYEKGVVEVDEMCVLLSQMMQYITNQSDFTTTIEREMKYTEMYLKLIKYRYEERFHYNIQMDERIDSIKIPMLLIQPIVENSILHGFSPEKPVLKVLIRGEMEDNQWKIIVEDNGKGFSEQTKKNLMQKLEEYEASNKIAGLGNVNVGLVNSYLRLKLDNNKKVLFDIISNSSYTQVIIGGEIDI